MRIENQLLVTKTGRMATASVKPKRTSTGVVPPSLFSSSDMELPLEGNAPTVFQLHPEEPNLYQIPSDLSPVYGTLPALLQVGVWLVATLSSAVLTWNQRLTWISPLVAITTNQVNFGKLLSFFVKTWIFATVTNGLLQELLQPPSRISVAELRNKYVLPSTLSRFEQVPVKLLPEKTTNLGVHYLQYQNSHSQQPARYQALYVNHGFGASSLSWLPVLPRMVDRLHARVGVGHDAVGFGFTDRPNDLEAFTTTASAAIGTALLQPQLLQPEPNNNNNNNNPEEESEDNHPSVLLMGHSMGSLATLQMALALPATTKKCVVLVAPALGMRPSSHRRKSLERQRKRWKNPLFLQKTLGKVGTGATWIGKYCLRRLVGRKNFWRTGLELAWGDPKRLSDGDVLRFQWPSIGSGWEDGMIQFSRAMAQPTSFTDRELVEKVLASNATTIKVIVGGRDRIVPAKQVKAFLQPYQDKIEIVEMEGLGHDPFEEDVEGFLDVLEQMLERQN